jgi:hypothetical protein
MNYRMDAQTGYMKLTPVNGTSLMSAEERVKKCEGEIAAVLDKYGCVLLVHVAARESQS